MLNYQHIVSEIHRIERVTLSVKDEITTLKNKVRAYKGWTTRYRQQESRLKQENLALSQEKDDAVRALENLRQQQQQLLENLKEAGQAKEERDLAISQLDEVINRIEQYREICDRLNQMTFARKEDLIKEAERLFFDDPVIDDNIKFDRQSQPQLFEDRASINRYLLDS